MLVPIEFLATEMEKQEEGRRGMRKRPTLSQSINFFHREILREKNTNRPKTFTTVRERSFRIVAEEQKERYFP